MKKGTGLTIEDGVKCTTLGQGDDGCAAGLSFEGDDSEILDLGKDDEACAAVELNEFGIADASEEPGIGSSEFFQAFEFGAGAGDAELSSFALGGFDGQINALIGFESTDIKPETFASDQGIGNELVEAHERMHNRGIALVASVHFSRSVPRIGDVSRDVHAGFLIPAAEGLAIPAESGATQAAALFVLLGLAPDPAGRTMAVTQVRDTLGGAQALDGRRTRREDEIKRCSAVFGGKS